MTGRCCHVALRAPVETFLQGSTVGLVCFTLARTAGHQRGTSNLRSDIGSNVGALCESSGNLNGTRRARCARWAEQHCPCARPVSRADLQLPWLCCVFSCNCLKLWDVQASIAHSPRCGLPESSCETMNLLLLALGLATLALAHAAPGFKPFLQGPEPGPIAEDGSSTSSLEVEHGSALEQQESKWTQPEADVPSKDLGRPPRYGERLSGALRAPSSSIDKKSLFRQGSLLPPRSMQRLPSQIQNLGSGTGKQSLFRQESSLTPKSAETLRPQLSPHVKRLQSIAKGIREQEQDKEVKRHSPESSGKHGLYLSKQIRDHSDMVEAVQDLQRFKDTGKNIPLAARRELEKTIERKQKAIQRMRGHIMDVAQRRHPGIDGANARSISTELDSMTKRAAEAEQSERGKEPTPELSTLALSRTFNEESRSSGLRHRGVSGEQSGSRGVASPTTRTTEQEHQRSFSDTSHKVENEPMLHRRDLSKGRHGFHAPEDPFEDPKGALDTSPQMNPKSQQDHETAKGIRKFHALRDSLETAKGQRKSPVDPPPHPIRGNKKMNVEKMWDDLSHSTQKGWDKDPKREPFGEVGQQMEALRKAEIKTGNLNFVVSGAKRHALGKVPEMLANKKEAETELERLEKDFQELNERKRKEAMRPAVRRRSEDDRPKLRRRQAPRPGSQPGDMPVLEQSSVQSSTQDLTRSLLGHSKSTKKAPRPQPLPLHETQRPMLSADALNQAIASSPEAQEHQRQIVEAQQRADGLREYLRRCPNREFPYSGSPDCAWQERALQHVLMPYLQKAGEARRRLVQVPEVREVYDEAGKAADAWPERRKQAAAEHREWEKENAKLMSWLRAHKLLHKTDAMKMGFPR